MREQRESDIRRLGQCLKLARQVHKRTQANLAEILSISPQQIQKYELGQNRIPADVILKLALELRTPVATFFPSEASFNLQSLKPADDFLVLLRGFLMLDEQQKFLVTRVC